MKKLKLEKFINESATISLIFNGLRLQKELNSSLKEYDLTLNHALIMLSIFFEPEKTIRSNEIVALIPMTKGNISHCTSSLEQKKLVSRKVIPNDLRGFEFSLTAKGQKQCISLIKLFDKVESECDKKFSAQKLKDFIEMSSEL
jgi:DNA-binding MarR family transcriptional regulator